MDTLDEQAVGEATSAASQAPRSCPYIVSLVPLRAGDRLSGGTYPRSPRRSAIARAAQPDGVAVDAGAYIGLHKVRKVHSLRATTGRLPASLRQPGVSNAEVHNLTLYNFRLAPPKRQEVLSPQFDGHLDYAHISIAATLTFEVADDGSGDVRAVALDDLGLERVAISKVDIQGANLRMLRGAEGTIRRYRPIVLFEWERDLSAQHGDAIDDYHAFFATLDYDVTVLQDTSPGRQIDYLAAPN